MNDKLQVVPKMSQPAANGHHGDNSSNNNHSRGGRNGNRGNRGKQVGTRNREKGNCGHSVSNVDDAERQPKGYRNSKKGKLVNDLVNFQYYRPSPAEFNHRRTRKATVDYQKEDYVHVSCQFVVREGDWQALTEIDSCVSWNDVVQVRLPCEELSSCPICLYPPVCPLSPVCGHAMCYSCALRFSDNCPGGDCPICHKPLIIADFRPLKTYPRVSYKVGDEIDMKLVFRERNGRIVCPAVDETDSNSTGKIPNISNDWGVKFSNVISASPSQILQQVLISQEEELKSQFAMLEDSDKESEPFIMRALEELQGKKDQCFDEIESSLKLKAKSSHEESEGSSSKRVYFYQCVDGQPIFIHPLNSRCLIHEYGSIEGSIPELTCTIVAMEHYTQSPELRSRYRYFSHLPLGCPFILCEVDVTPFIGEETYQHFKSDFDRRSKARRVKEQKENAYTSRLSKKLAEKEVTYHCSAYLPKYTEVSQPAVDHYKTAESYDMLAGSPSSPPSDHAPLSFAEKLRAGASKSTPWMKSSVSPDRFRINSTSSDISVDSEVAAPSYQHSFRASLNDAFASLDVTEPVSAAPPTRGKKKKNKGKTISLTGGARRC